MKYIIIFIFFIFFNCTKNNNLKNIDITKNILHDIDLSKISKKIKLIKLNYGDYKIFGNVKQVGEIKGKYLLRSSLPLSLTVIDSLGNIVNQKEISNDKSPNSITGLNEFDIDKNKIFVLDREHFKIWTLNSNLEVLSSIEIPFFCQSFKILKDDKIILYTGHEVSNNNIGRFIIYNYKTKTKVNEFINIGNTYNYFRFLTTNHILRLKNHYLLWDSTIDTIYRYKKNINPNIFIDYGKHKLPNNFYKNNNFNNSYDFITKMRKSNFGFRHFNFKSNNNYLKFTYEFKGQFINSLYNLNTGKTYNFNNINDDLITNKKLSGLNFFSDFLNKKKYIAYVPYELLDETSKSNQKDALLIGEFTF